MNESNNKDYLNTDSLIPPMKSRTAWNVTALFLLLVFGFTLATIILPAKTFSEKENRPLAQRPSFRAQDILDGTFETGYEKYLTDQFVFRDEWITLRTMAERLALKSDVHDVYFGKDDYLIEKHTGVFESERAAANARLLIGFASEAADRYGEEHVTVMLVPNAVDILRDHLPLFAAPYDEEIYLESIRSKLPAAVWFDASAVLREHTDEQLYYRTDHHWTTPAAFYVFQSWAAWRGLGEVSAQDYEVTTLTEDFQGTIAAKVGTRVKSDTILCCQKKDGAESTLVYNQSDDVRSTPYQLQALEGRDKYTVFFGGNFGLIQGSTGAGTGRRLLVIKDSYAHCFAPFLLDLFDEVDLLDLRYFNQSLRQWLDEQDYTDILVLHNAAGFAEDNSINRLAS